MPLHLLGKKSWNVYNSDNIARVRRDEAEAQSRTREQERRLQDHESENRLARLREGDNEPLENSLLFRDEKTIPDSRDKSRKRRRLAGEDDTDRDIRIAYEQSKDLEVRRSGAKPLSDFKTLFSPDGHIDLVQEKQSGQSKHAKSVVESGNTGTRPDEQGLVLLRSATGRNQGDEPPWYNSSNAEIKNSGIIGKDVWGNEDPGRIQREARRLNSNDPLAAMKTGVKMFREVERQKKEWREERERDLKEVEVLAREEKRQKRRKNSGTDSLEDFDLDKGLPHKHSSDGKKSSKHEHRSHHGRRHHRHHSLQKSHREGRHRHSEV